MAVVNTKSTIVTNLDSTPAKQNALNVAGARLREQVATVELAAADDDGSVYRFFRVRSSDRASSIEVFNDAITSGTSFDLGVYRTAADGGAVVDADLWGSAISMASARVAPLDVTFEAADIANIEKSIWQLLGLSADPQIEYDIALTANTVGSAAGTIALRLRLVDGT